jgi:hypothetical protein
MRKAFSVGYPIRKRVQRRYMGIVDAALLFGDSGRVGVASVTHSGDHALMSVLLGTAEVGILCNE